MHLRILCEVEVLIEKLIACTDIEAFVFPCVFDIEDEKMRQDASTSHYQQLGVTHL